MRNNYRKRANNRRSVKRFASYGRKTHPKNYAKSNQNPMSMRGGIRL